MRILIYECLPRRLKGDLTGHDARTVPEMCWARTRNGELLQLMVADHFEALLTVDHNLPFQQNLRRAGVGAVLVYARSNRVQELRPLIPPILKRCNRSKPANSSNSASRLRGA